MDPLPQINVKIGDTVIIKHGEAKGLGTILAINLIDYEDTYGRVLVSWEIFGLSTHFHTSLETVDRNKLCWL